MKFKYLITPALLLGLLGGCVNPGPGHLLKVTSLAKDKGNAEHEFRFEELSLHSEEYDLNYRATIVSCDLTDPVRGGAIYNTNRFDCPTPPVGYTVRTYNTMGQINDEETHFKYTFSKNGRTITTEFNVVPALD